MTENVTLYLFLYVYIACDMITRYKVRVRINLIVNVFPNINVSEMRDGS